ncbi:MAG: hypothetical protein EPGJADBJ_04134 [Saprospiraceae bacterium]|nr:hypothetical protein [Saprospiraceae bacterium]
MTKSFNTDMSSDNAMKQIYSLKQFYIDLGCMPKFLLNFFIFKFFIVVQFLMKMKMSHFALLIQAVWLRKWRKCGN